MTKYEKLINELHQAVLGVPGTEDGGMAGDIKKIKDDQKENFIATTKNTVWRKVIAGVGGTVIVIVVPAFILHLIGVY